ncbi:MAG: nitroreductase [Candidatus Hydrogenedentota bacterium]|nr:MAG: nitroreductase [Candidatus Hydrogenedentota bacterium]
MELYDLLANRYSVRAFKPDPIDPEKINRAISYAQRAPSWKNVQPYEVHAVTGKLKEELSTAFLENIAQKIPPHPDEPYQDKWPTYMKRRMFNLGQKLYEFLGIARNDQEARQKQFEQNYRFFGAPVVLFFFTEKEMKFWPEFDVGIFYGYVMLALLNEGIGSCPQASITIYPDMVREKLNLPENKKLLAGMSIGYPAETKINQFRSEREELDKILFWHN